jgi:hypothetical protein
MNEYFDYKYIFFNIWIKNLKFFINNFKNFDPIK